MLHHIHRVSSESLRGRLSHDQDLLLLSKASLKCIVVLHVSVLNVK